MRIPLPEKIKVKYVVIFAVLLFLVQQAEGTNIVYSMLCAAYLMTACAAFNAAGGLVLPSGAWIFFNAILVVIVGITTKAFLGEAGETDLRTPFLTMSVETLAMAAYGFGGALARRLMPKEGWLAQMALGESMKRAAMGAAMIGLSISIAQLGRLSEEGASGSLISALHQLNHFPEMAMLLAVFYEVKASGGRKSTNWVYWFAALSSAFFGLIGFSKQGTIVPAFCWFVAAVGAGHNFTRKQLVGLVGGFVFFQLFAAPLLQSGRPLLDPDKVDVMQALTVAGQMVSNASEVRAKYAADLAEVALISEGPRLTDKPHGFIDRLSMLAPDDALIDYTVQANTIGYTPVIYGMYNIIPHFLWKDKPTVFFGNLYGRELGIIGEQDESTGISFSPASDAYQEGEWVGVCVMLPALAFLLFYIQNSLSGDIRLAPWGILFVVIAAHEAPEGSIGGMTYDLSYTPMSVAFVALMGKYVLPILSGIVTNTERTRVRRTIDFKPRDPRPQDRGGAEVGIPLEGA